jgi:hypothetical protein
MEGDWIVDGTSIFGLPIVGLTAPALLGIMVLFFMLGRIVPRVTLLDKQRECDRWREAYEVERDARATANRQTIELLEVVKTNHAIITAIFQNIEQRNKKPGDPDATL